MKTCHPTRRGLLALAAVSLLAHPVLAADDNPETEERLSTMERAIEVVTNEQDRLRTALAVPEDGKLVSYGGLGPAASKIYGKEKGLSLGGYGEWRGRFKVADHSKSRVEDDILDALRAVLYVGYKFNDWILVNSEFEFEHAGTGGGGDVSTEFLTLDFLFAEEVNARAGLVLIPMGFINEIHEPVYFFSASRPEVERRIIPTTWRENGAGFFGTIAEMIQYRVYGVNSLKAEDFTSDGFRGGRQKGSEALADHFSFVARVDVTPCDGVLIGGSVYTGKQGQNRSVTRTVGGVSSQFRIPDALTTIFETHVEVKRWGASFRGLYAQSHIKDADRLNRATGQTTDNDGDGKPDDGVASRMRGGYVELGYDVLPLFLEDSEQSFEPFYRFEVADTQNKAAPGFQQNDERDRRLHVVGFNYKPHPQVVIKFDYRNISTKGNGGRADEVEVGFGYVF